MNSDSKSSSENHNLKKITSNRLFIKHGFIKAGDVSFQLSNIVSLSVEQNLEQVLDTTVRLFFISFSIYSVILLVGSRTSLLPLDSSIFPLEIAAFLFALAISYLFYRSKIKCELHIITNAATSFKLINKSKNFLVQLKNAIEESIEAQGGPIAYNVNISDHKIERMEVKTEMNTVTVSNSPGTNVANKARNVKQSSNVSTQQDDISELVQIVNSTKTEMAEMLRLHLEIVQGYFAGGRTKGEAKQSWAAFVEHIGLFAQAGSRIFELAARIGSALG
jgi:hypothetical protein